MALMEEPLVGQDSRRAVQATVSDSNVVTVGEMDNEESTDGLGRVGRS